ncbi:MAG: HD domain-containing protein [Bacilli bacterium]|nr:HD domain-containing protein [Bacilli bacterium]
MQKDINNKNFVKNQNAYTKYKKYIHNDVLKLYYQLTHLKNLYRQGWLTHIIGMNGENIVESVADHSWSVTMLSMTIIQKYNLNLDLEKCMKLSLVHELGEVYAGDFIPNQISSEQKHKLEEKAVDILLGEANFITDFKKLWLEYENQLTEEAIFVKQVDKLEPILQAVSYDLKPKDFFKDDSITLPYLRDLLNEVYKIPSSKLTKKL